MKVMFEELPGAAGEIFLVGAAAEAVELAVVAPKPRGFVVTAKREEEFDALIPRHGVVGVVVEEEEGCGR